MFQRLLKFILPVAFGVALQTFPANALGGHVLIAQVQAGSSAGDGASTQEFISIYNNSTESVDITDWCVGNKSNVLFACFTSPDANTALMLTSHTYALIASDSFATRYAGTYDAVFTVTNNTSGNLVGSGDTITLRDKNGISIDSTNWATSLAGGSVWTRQWMDQDAGVMLDTDMVSDFKKVTPLEIPSSGVIEEVHEIDLCANLEGIQQTLPSRYGLNAEGDCALDLCVNIDDLQVEVPAGMRLDTEGRCFYNLPLLAITELLPNAVGSDDGNEFIEIYNPNEHPVDLSLYRLQIGLNFEKTYLFKAGMSIEPHMYQALFNDTISFSLLNTSSRARLITVDGQVISETPLYSSPTDDEAWAFLANTWMFTNQPTPGLENLLPSEDETLADGVVTSSLKACAANQYRNPETNRCRSLATTINELQPCKDGQYRSEETNRCRSIASDVSEAKPCAEDQYRNPNSGRCKKIASEDEVQDCGEGRERNPTTNRCRNVVTMASGTTSGGISLVPAPAASILGWWAAAIVGFVALGYAALEWRSEIVRQLKRGYGDLRGRISRLRYNKRNEDYRN